MPPLCVPSVCGGIPLAAWQQSAHRRGKLKVGRLMFDRQGGKVVFFGRFISILRTYVAFVAGVNRMAWRRFFLYNAAGNCQMLWIRQ
jgi:membrane protein DedA with SNARE-associated domain